MNLGHYRAKTADAGAQGGGCQNRVAIAVVGQFIGIGVRRSVQQADHTFYDGVGHFYLDRDAANGTFDACAVVVRQIVCRRGARVDFSACILNSLGKVGKVPELTVGVID